MEHGSVAYDAPWVKPWAHFEPYRFAYTFWRGDECMGRMEMVQLTPAVEIPLPAESNQKLKLDETQYCWAQLKSVDAAQLEACLQEAGIDVEPPQGFIAASARAIRRRVRRLRVRR